MKPVLFISYSRRQTPFVDRLAEQLVKNGYNLWLDYHNLVPAKPWFEQITAGVQGAEVVLLVVSKDSIASKNVEPEWRLALELKKRIILLIFETCPLPRELQNCEWVDFRGNFKKNMQQLQNLFDQPINRVSSGPPQSGFKAPVLFWLALILSVIVLLGSIPLWWTVLIPFILVPLPRQIFKRNYILTRVAVLLAALPLLLLTTSDIFLPLEEGTLVHRLNSFIDAWIVPTTLASWTLLVILFSPSIQRRALPEAAVPRFANPHIIDVPSPRAVKFLVDYAPEDAPCAEELCRFLEREGHQFVRPTEKPETIFVLLSTYKKHTEYDPDYQAVFPVLLQTVRDVDPELQRIQWIDFGHGIRNIHILARLLPEPENLLRAFAMPPLGSREFFPLSVNGLQYFFVLTAVVAASHFWASLLSIGSFPSQASSIFGAAINVILLFTVVLYALKGLRSRRGGTSTFYPLLVLTIFLAVIAYFNLMSTFFNFGAGPDALELLEATGSNGILIALLLCPLVLFITLLSFVVRWRTLRYRWLPRHHDSVDRLEGAFLLFTPLQRHKIVFHIIFHVVLLIVYVMFMLADNGVLSWSTFGYLLPVFLILLWGIHWLARRDSPKGG